ncbi:MAG: nuclear transport factor 2 family protein [Pseudomonadota bacterium]
MKLFTAKNLLVAALFCATFASAIPVSYAQDEDAQLQQLARDIAQFEAEIASLEAENAIENLQRIYGFYIDKNQWSQAADLFSETGSIEIGGEGEYVGKARILAYLQSKGAEGPQQGILNDQMQLQPVVHIYPDGTAKGRWHHFSQEAVAGVSHHWGTGIYENEYVFEDGVWKISKLHLYTTMRTPYEDGWGVTALPRTTASTTLPPDVAPVMDYENYPAVFVPPFHYANPVTNPAPVPRYNESTVADLDSVESIEQKLTGMEKQVGLLQDADAVERLHTIYGYYLAHNQWDEMAGIFAEDGTIEIALRGVYKGRAGVRRNLDLYGVQNELEGTLHNHMQYQPVIHIADDGQSALMRSRAFSMMGNYEGQGTWMGGIYENIFVKRDGVWQILKDQAINTYFASYDVGWKDLALRPAPGINKTNPPDAPPSGYFEMYPSPFLPPYHYKNPVTGR